MQGEIFQGLHTVRPNSRVLMHFTDVGNGAADELLATFKCTRCGYESDWLICSNKSEVKRGVPCPDCNTLENPVISGVDRTSGGWIGQP